MVKRLAQPHILEIAPYQPGKPIEEVAREIGLDDAESISKLASNENPLGPSPKAVAAIRKALTRINLYPDGNGYYLKEALSQKLGVVSDKLILGNGSNEIIELIMHVFAGGDHTVVFSQTSFLVYRLMVLMFGVNAIEVPMKDFTTDLRGMAEKITSKTRVVFIANPNNPTGTAVEPQELGAFLRDVPPEVVVVVDEAYYEYLPDQLKFNGLSYTDVDLGLAPVVLLRTFSKIYGLAGLRIGYGIGSEEMIGVLNRVRQPFNTNLLAQIGARAALDDEEHFNRTLSITRQGREMLEQGFQRLGLPFVPSVANFVLVKVGNGEEIFQKLLKKGIIIRPMDFYDLPEYVRVTVGLPEENERFLKELEKIIK